MLVIYLASKPILITEMEKNMTAEVFVTSYGLYNNGFQFVNGNTGFWIDCANFDESQVIDTLSEEQKRLIDPLEDDVELMFTDYDGFPKAFYCESGIDFELIEEYESLDELEQVAFEYLTDVLGYDASDALSKASDVIVSEQSASDYVYDFVNECYDLPEFVRNYFDYDALARDMTINGEIDTYGDYLIIGANAL